MPASDGPEKEIGDEGKDRELHFTFVELLFSLAVAEIAQRIAVIIDEAEGDFLHSKYWPCYSHLFLSLILITTSWIGWGKSKASHRNSKFASVFRRDFLELLIDVVIVVVYFVLVHRSEKIEIDPSTKMATVTPSVVPEAICVAVVFALYFAWDVVSKWPKGKGEGNRHEWDELKERGVISLIAMVVAVATASAGWISISADSTQTIAFDFCLVFLVVTFRELKQAATDTPRQYWHLWKNWRVWVPAISYVLLLLGTLVS